MKYPDRKQRRALWSSVPKASRPDWTRWNLEFDIKWRQAQHG